jgi:hypothetical protein
LAIAEQTKHNQRHLSKSNPQFEELSEFVPQKLKPKRVLRSAQHQARQPGLEAKMRPKPKAEDPAYCGSGKLQSKVAVITGGDSGIGRAVAIIFAEEVAPCYVFLAADDSSYITGQVLHPNGGEIVNG